MTGEYPGERMTCISWQEVSWSVSMSVCLLGFNDGGVRLDISEVKMKLSMQAKTTKKRCQGN